MTATDSTTDFADVVGVNVRSQMLQHLASTDIPKKQFEIAEELDVSQASVSRSTKELLEVGVIEKDSKDRIVIDPSVEAGVGKFRQAIQ